MGNKRQLPAEASILAAQTSTQLNVRKVEYDTSAEKDEFNRIQMQEFAIQAEEAFDAQDKSSLRKLVKKSDDVETFLVPR